MVTKHVTLISSRKEQRIKDKKQLLAVLLSMAMILSSYLPVHASEEKAVPITEAAPTNEYEHVDADET